MQDKDFSIVIPAYNNLPLFQQALESVRRQQNVSMEIIVVDDSDKSMGIEEYVRNLSDSRITYQHNTPSLGAVFNWNHGLSHCRGKYVMLIHHDESFQTDDILLQVKKTISPYEIAVCNIKVRRSDGKVYGLAPAWVKRWIIHFPSILYAINVLGPSAVIVFRWNCLQQFDTRIHWFVDVEWYYRMLKGRTACYIPTAMILSYHGHREQISCNINTIQEAKKDATILRSKYNLNLPVLLAIWIHIHILHDTTLNRFIKKILKR